MVIGKKLACYKLRSEGIKGPTADHIHKGS